MSRNLNTSNLHGQPAIARGSVVPQRGGSSAGAAQSNEPGRTFFGSGGGGGGGRGAAHWSSGDATTGLLNATRQGLREEDENLSNSDNDDLPRWNVGRRSGPRMTLDGSASLPTPGRGGSAAWEQAPSSAGAASQLQPAAAAAAATAGRGPRLPGPRPTQQMPALPVRGMPPQGRGRPPAQQLPYRGPGGLGRGLGPGGSLPAAAAAALPGFLQGTGAALLKTEPGDIAGAARAVNSPISPPMAQAAAAAAAQTTASGLVHVPIICNGNRGRFLLERQSCVCHCKGCFQRAERAGVSHHEMTPTEFERHSGMAASKKWKYTLRVDKPEAKSCTLGAYLDQLGVLEKSGRCQQLPSTLCVCSILSTSRSARATLWETLAGTSDTSCLLVGCDSCGRSGSGRFIQAAASAVAAAAANTGSIQPLLQPKPGDPETEEPPHSDSEADEDLRREQARGGSGPGFLANTMALNAADADEDMDDGDIIDAEAAAAALLDAQREAQKQAAARPGRSGRGRARGRGRSRGARGRGRPPNWSPSYTPERVTPEPAFGEGENGQLGTPPEVGAVDAVLNLSKDKWLKPSPAYAKRDRKPAIREGPQYQAVVPEGPPLPRPSGSEEEDLRAGTRGPTPEEMLALAAGPEKDAASSLPPDARTDDATTANINGKTVLLQRGQRARKRPVWLANTIDPQLADTNRMARAAQRPFSALRYNGVESSERESQQYGSDTSGANNAAAVGGSQRRRKRSAAPFDPYGGGGGYHPRETEEHLTVPKRLRTTMRDPQLWRGGSSAVEASPSPRVETVPEVVSWQLLEPQLLFVLVQLGDFQYGGTLMLEARDAREPLHGEPLPAPALPGALIDADDSNPVPAPWGELDEAQGLGASTNPSTITAPETEVEGGSTHPDVPAGPLSAALVPRPDDDGGEVQSPTEEMVMGEADRKPEAVKGNPARRAAAAAEYQRLSQEGAPPGTRCALCHNEQEDGDWGKVSLQRSLMLTPDAATNHGLGPLLLVKVSAIANAWVHSQCAVWSPEVYESMDGKLEKVGIAVRRGRMIKCRFCGHRGATLGCHIRSCRTSFHLPCARYNGSRLDGNGRVTCPQHTHLVESEPIIPVPGADGYDDDSGGGGGPGGNDDDDLSDDLPDDGDEDGGDGAAREQINGGRGGHRQRGPSASAVHGRQRAAVAPPSDDDMDEDEDCEDGEDDEELPDVSVGAGTPAGLPPAASLSGPFIADTGGLRPRAPATAGGRLPRAPGTARERYEMLLADADIANAANHSRFGGTVGRSMFRPGRCAVCVEQRKGKCGSNMAPKRCLRRQANELALRIGRRPVGRPRRDARPLEPQPLAGPPPIRLPQARNALAQAPQPARRAASTLPVRAHPAAVAAAQRPPGRSAAPTATTGPPLERVWQAEQEKGAAHATRSEGNNLATDSGRATMERSWQEELKKRAARAAQSERDDPAPPISPGRAVMDRTRQQGQKKRAALAAQSELDNPNLSSHQAPRTQPNALPPQQGEPPSKLASLPDSQQPQQQQRSSTPPQQEQQQQQQQQQRQQPQQQQQQQQRQQPQQQPLPPRQAAAVLRSEPPRPALPLPQGMVLGRPIMPPISNAGGSGASPAVPQSAGFAAQCREVAAGANGVPASRDPRTREQPAPAGSAAATQGAAGPRSTFIAQCRAVAANARSHNAGGEQPQRQLGANPVQGMGTPLPKRANPRPVITTLPLRSNSVSRSIVTTLPVRAPLVRSPPPQQQQRGPRNAPLVTSERLTASASAPAEPTRQHGAPSFRAQAAERTETARMSAAAQPASAGRGRPDIAASPAPLPPPTAQKAEPEPSPYRQTAEDELEGRSDDVGHAWDFARSPSKGTAVGV